MRSKKIKVCFVSGGRADFGLLFWPLQLMKKESSLHVQLILGQGHVSKFQGASWKQVSAVVGKVDAVVKFSEGTRSGAETAIALAQATQGFAQAFKKLAPDWVFLFGDRFELLGAAQAALVMGIPIAHVFGGDETLGAYDNSIRHAITKMASLHFVSNEESFRRVLQMGENPSTVYNIGSPSLDHFRRTQLLTKSELEERLAVDFSVPTLLATFHPETLTGLSFRKQIEEFTKGLNAFVHRGGQVIWTAPNLDTGGKEIQKGFSDWAQEKTGVYQYKHLGSQVYLSLLRAVSVMVGNTSSGLYESSLAGVPVVNVGDRQQGRLRGSNVIDVKLSGLAIKKGLEKALRMPRSPVVSPYGDGRSSERLINVFKSKSSKVIPLQKRFHFLET